MTVRSKLVVGMVLVLLVVPVGIVIADEARINSVEVVNATDGDGDRAVSAFNLRIVADTNCLGCNDESDDEPNIDPQFVVTAIGSDGNDVVLGESEQVENADELEYVFEVPTETIEQFDSQTLEIQVTLRDKDLLADDDVDTRSITVEFERSSTD